MLKFIKHHLESIIGIEIFPIISFLIFFLFFLLMILWLVFSDKKTMNHIAALPLESNPEDHEEHS